MNYELSTIRSDVRTALDQNQREDGVLSVSEYNDVDTLSLDQIIDQKVLDAAQEILTVAPLRLIDWSVVEQFEAFDGDLDALSSPEEVVTPGDSEVESSSDGGGEEPTPGETEEGSPAEGSLTDALLVPGDFLRIYRIKYWDWDYGVSEFVMEDEDTAKIVRSSFPGIRPSSHRPLVVMVDHGIGQNGRVLRCYGQGNGVRIQSAKYVKIPSLFNGVLFFPARLYPALVYKIASLVEATYRNYNAAQAFQALSNNIIGIVPEQSGGSKRVREQ